MGIETRPSYWSAVIGSLSLGYAYPSLHLVERPARRWARRRAGHLSAAEIRPNREFAPTVGVKSRFGA